MAVSPYIKAASILATPDCHVMPIFVNYGLADTLLAGQPLSADGAAVNDGSAIGILLQDVHKELDETVGLLVIAGMIDTDAAEANCGVEVSAEAKANLKNIVFTGDTYAAPVEIPEPGAEDIGKTLTVVAGEDDAPVYGLVAPETPETPEAIELKSSTEGSTKVFLVTVDDDGELAATEKV